MNTITTKDQYSANKKINLKLLDVFQDAAEELGSENNDFNKGDNTGVGFFNLLQVLIIQAKAKM